MVTGSRTPPRSITALKSSGSQAARWALLVAATVGGLSCVEPRTEIIVRVTTDLPWGPKTSLRSVLVRVRREGETTPLHERETALGLGSDARTLPLYVGVLPAGDDLTTPLSIEALGCGAPGRCADAPVRQRAVVSFVRGQTREVTLTLYAACVGGACRADQLCRSDGSCGPATQAPVRDFVAIGPPKLLDAAALEAPPMDLPDAPRSDVDAVDALDAPRADVDAMDIPDAPRSEVDAADLRDLAELTDRPDVRVLPDATTPAEAGDCGAPDAATPRCPAGMIGIPSGRFIMGGPSSAMAAPRHGVELSAYCIDETEVTASAYDACVARGLCTPAGRSATIARCNSGAAERGDHPINCVRWLQASQYCREMRGGELPTEAQWEYAARGIDDRPYPWGSTPIDRQVCWEPALTGTPYASSTCPVRYTLNPSPFGLYDMVGNVGEFTADRFTIYTGDTMTYVCDPRFEGPAAGAESAIRGGDVRSVAVQLTTYWRTRATSMINNPDLGFRCARRSL